MSDTLEIAFEELDEQAAVDLLLHLLSLSEDVENIKLGTGENKTSENSPSKEDVLGLFGAGGDHAEFFNVRLFKIGKVEISSALIRLVRYGGKYDVDFGFEAPLLGDARALMKSLHEEIKLLAERYNASSFCGGLEPATDAETQYFCNGHDGPLMRA